MIVKSIELHNFRNYEQLSGEFDSNINIFYGANAQGKTNILESIYVSGTTKSHKGTKDRDLIKFNEDDSHIRTVIMKDNRSYQIDIHLKRNKTKGIAINKIPIKKASELFGILNIVFFSPEDLNMIKSGPSERRRFLDLELCQLDKIYLNDLSFYNKILNQRNKLLKDISYKEDLVDTLSTWDNQLWAYGKKIIETRSDFIEKLNEIVCGIHNNLTGCKENLVLKYEPNVCVEHFEEVLQSSRKKDLKQRMTTVGPHRDDLSFFINGIDIRKYGSQGQQRTTALSLKMAEIELVKQIIKDTPVLLLDDVLSELDGDRQNYLLNSIHDIQTLITCTGLDEFIKNRFHVNKVFNVLDGNIYIKNEM